MPPPRPPGPRKPDALFHRSAEPVFVLDPAGRFSYVNPAWERLTGRDSRSVLGLDPALDGEGLGLFLPPAEAFTGRPACGRILVSVPDGATDPRRIDFQPIHAEVGGPPSILGILRGDPAPAPAESSLALEARAQLAEVRSRLRDRLGEARLIGLGPRHDRLVGQVAVAATGRGPCLIVGEMGTGKRLVAGSILGRGAFAESSIIHVDVEALGLGPLERILFGDDRTASLVLGDVAALPRDLQARLVPELRTPGARRLLMTSTVQPEIALADGRYREDFYYAITLNVLTTPPLRERRDEIPLLALEMLGRANRRSPKSCVDFTPKALEILKAYDWPGNVGELARVVDSAHERAKGRALDAADLPGAIQGEYAAAFPPSPLTSRPISLDDWLGRVERRLIESALAKTGGNKSRAAESLGLSRPRLHRRIKELGIADSEPSDAP